MPHQQPKNGAVGMRRRDAAATAYSEDPGKDTAVLQVRTVFLIDCRLLTHSSQGTVWGIIQLQVINRPD
jgi:hypothetical protein